MKSEREEEQDSAMCILFLRIQEILGKALKKIHQNGTDRTGC
jgi:hypothetical protein